MDLVISALMILGFEYGRSMIRRRIAIDLLLDEFVRKNERRRHPVSMLLKFEAGEICKVHGAAKAACNVLPGYL
jgi:hypothetical protein